MSDNSRKFLRAERGKYSLEEKNALGELVKKYKEEYYKQVENSAIQINYNGKMRKHTKKTPREGFIARAVGEFYDDLKDVKHPKFTAAFGWHGGGLATLRISENEILNSTEIKLFFGEVLRKPSK